MNDNCHHLIFISLGIYVCNKNIIKIHYIDIMDYVISSMILCDIIKKIIQRKIYEEKKNYFIATYTNVNKLCYKSKTIQFIIMLQTGSTLYYKRQKMMF